MLTLMLLLCAQVNEGGIKSQYLDDFQFARIDAGKPPANPELILERPSVGDVGVFPYEGRDYFVGTRIFQIVDAETMLVDVVFFTPKITVYPGQLGGGPTTIIGPARENGRKTIMVKGVSTKNKSDDEGVKLSGAFECAGTETYETAIGGTKTVYVFSPYDKPLVSDIAAKKWSDKQAIIQAAKQAEQDKANAAEEERAAKEKAKRLRVWKSKDGQFFVEAYFVEMKDGKVTLERKDSGDVVAVAASTLSGQDLLFIRDFRH